MKTLFYIEAITNLILVVLYHLHMFQLNSYFYEKHFNWMKNNKSKIIKQVVLPVITLILVIFNNKACLIFADVVMLALIICNIPKEKSKIPLKYTARVKRMLITEFIIVLVILLVGRRNFAITLSILNALAFALCLISNLINKPIEIGIKNYYINDAKKILKSMPNLTVIGVTGSYGKTSVKNYLGKMLSQKYEVLITPKNYNTTMGVVKTIRENLRPTHQIFVCEMGATHVGDIKEICDIVNPTIGIITAVGPQHLESFKSIDNILNTKFELADSVENNNGVMFLNYSNELIAGKQFNGKKFTYGIDNKKLDCNAYNIKVNETGLTFTINTDINEKSENDFETNLLGEHNVINLAGAIACSNYLGIPLKKLVPKVREIKSVKHRLELVSHGRINIIDDAYNSNPVSSKYAINALSKFNDGIRVLVTPGLIELGSEQDKFNYELGKFAKDKVDYIYIVGNTNSKSIIDGAVDSGFDKSKIKFANGPQEAVASASQLDMNKPITILLENDLPDNYQ